MINKTIRIAFLAGIALISDHCGRNNSNDSKPGIAQAATEMAVDFETAKFSNPNVEKSADGKVTISEKGVSLLTMPEKFIISPQEVFTGDLNGDGEPDAIVSVAVLKRDFPEATEHIVFTSSEGRLALNRTLESNMKIFTVKNGIITAEVHTHPPSSPLYNCNSCKEVVKFRFENGEFIRTVQKD